MQSFFFGKDVLSGLACNLMRPPQALQQAVPRPALLRALLPGAAHADRAEEHQLLRVDWVVESVARCHVRPLREGAASRERIFIELVTSDRKLKASREGSK